MLIGEKAAVDSKNVPKLELMRSWWMVKNKEETRTGKMAFKIDGKKF